MGPYLLSSTYFSQVFPFALFNIYKALHCLADGTCKLFDSLKRKKGILMKPALNKYGA